MKKYIRYVSVLGIVVALSLQAKLLFPSNSGSWASNPTRYFISAAVYAEAEIVALKNGTAKTLHDGSRPEDPVEFANTVIANGKLVGGEPGMQHDRFYVVPRLHPALETFVPSYIILTVSLIFLALVL